MAYLLGNSDINKLIFHPTARQVIPCVAIGTMHANVDCPPCQKEAAVAKLLSAEVDYNQIRRCLMALPDWDSRQLVLNILGKDEVRIEIRFSKPIIENGKKIKGQAVTIKRP